jgi:dethiobiotin synthetase
MGKALFITGTGTDVGKTALSLAVILWAGKRGLRTAYHKPVQCGTFVFGDPPRRGGDADWIRSLAGEKAGTFVTYQLHLPASPHLAAEREGESIDLGRIRSDVSELMEGTDLLVLEGAGGPAVPLDRSGVSLAHLASELSIPALIACAPGLGTLHHTLGTLAYLEARKAPVAGFAFCHRLGRRDPDSSDTDHTGAEAGPADSGPDLTEDNRETLRGLTELPFFGDLAFLEPLSRGVRPTPEAEDRWIAPLLPSLDAWWNGTRA